MFVKDVLITDYVHPLLIQGLHAQGFSTTYAPEMSRAEMEEHLPFYKGVVVNTRCALDAKAISSAPRLEWIARLGSGLDIIDLEAAAKANVHVFSAPEGNAEAVAEHALGMLLALSNKLISAHQHVIEGEWPREAHRGWEIAGKTIGIIGYGNNGSAFGRLWQGWDVHVLAYDKYLEGYAPSHVQETDLETLIAEADIISLHIPLTDETKELVNAAFIQKCKPGFVLINTSRGKNVNLHDVLTSLQTGQIKGACLDVFPVEPPSAGPDTLRESFAMLCKLDNVVLTPHVAGWTMESKRKIAQVLLRKISTIGAPRSE
jgi:D-3-phosphoglycerate dehydrogenase